MISSPHTLYWIMKDGYANKLDLESKMGMKKNFIILSLEEAT
jgi:hypothetical protein